MEFFSFMKNARTTFLLPLLFTALISLRGTTLGGPEDSVGYNPRLEETKEIRKSFAILPEVLKPVSESAKLTLYEGLPHQVWESDDLEAELKSKDTVKRFGFPFYEKPVAVSEADVEKLRSLIQAPGAFKEFYGHKACGGFHPDYSLTWTEGSETTEIHLCFGCGEIKAFLDDREVYCEFGEDSQKEFRLLLENYRVQRPKKEE